jgi:ribosomal protein S18 acetylase RimI-like enzyme
MTDPSVHLVGPERVPLALRTMAEGMRDDPALAWLFPDERTRTQRVERLFHLASRLYPDAEIYATEDLTAAAFWIRPRRFHVPPGRQVRLLWPTIKALGGIAGMRMSSAVDASHPKEPDHYYLLILAATPGHRGRGLGSQLMQPVLERCDQDGVAAYLESANPRNQAFYVRLGFEARQEIRPPGGCPSLTGMWRDPRQG